MTRRPPRSTLSSSSAASDVYKRQLLDLPPKPRRRASSRPYTGFGQGGALRHRVRECGRGFAGVRVVTVLRSPSPVVEVPRCVLTTGWVGESHVGVVSTPSRYLVVGGGVTGGSKVLCGRGFRPVSPLRWCA